MPGGGDPSLSLDWEGQSYKLELDRVTGWEYDQIEREYGLTPFQVLEFFDPVQTPVVDEEGDPVMEPVLDDKGQPTGELRQKVQATPKRPDGKITNVIAWLFFRQAGDTVKLRKVDVPFLDFWLAFAESNKDIAEVISEEEDGPKGSPTTGPGSTGSGSTTDSTSPPETS